jgi:hypothetical protein
MGGSSALCILPNGQGALALACVCASVCDPDRQRQGRGWLVSHLACCTIQEGVHINFAARKCPDTVNLMQLTHMHHSSPQPSLQEPTSDHYQCII